MGEAFPVSHAAALCAQLPAESRICAAAGIPEDAEMSMWSPMFRMAAMLLNETRYIAWSRSADAYEGGDPPERILPPELRGGIAQPGIAASDYRRELESIRERIRESKGGGPWQEER